MSGCARPNVQATRFDGTVTVQEIQSEVVSPLSIVSHFTGLDRYKTQLKCDFCRIQTVLLVLYSQYRVAAEPHPWSLIPMTRNTLARDDPDRGYHKRRHLSIYPCCRLTTRVGCYTICLLRNRDTHCSTEQHDDKHRDAGGLYDV